VCRVPCPACIDTEDEHRNARYHPGHRAFNTGAAEPFPSGVFFWVHRKKPRAIPREQWESSKRVWVICSHFEDIWSHKTRSRLTSLHFTSTAMPGE
jgi:hypothetical protein